MLRPITIAALMLTASAAGAARKDQPIATPDGAPISCVTTNLIRETRVRDDKTIDFYMRGGKVLRNTLPNSCPELGFEQRFGYTVSTNRLCSVDIITVLRQAGGLQRGTSCGLGQFQPVKLTGKGAR